jgi:RimJ/RimL family protein N-acetyltransferase
MDIEIAKQIHSERFLLRCYQKGDGKMYYAAGQRNRQHLLQFEAGNAILTPKDEAEAERLGAELADLWEQRKCFFFGIFDKGSGEWMGQIYVGVVDWEAPEFELGYIVDVDHQGQGIITESAGSVLQFLFQHLNAHRVRLECDETNEPSWRVAERVGFVREGHLRQNHRWADGTFTGTFLYGLLRSEYLQNHLNRSKRRDHGATHTL